MQVGDLVKTRDWIKPSLWGVVITIKRRSRQIQCLWHDGETSWCLNRSVEVV